jgi:hypothetical protein
MFGENHCATSSQIKAAWEMLHKSFQDIDPKKATKKLESYLCKEYCYDNNIVR